MLLTLSEELVRKLPSLRHHLPETISVELANEGGEVVVLEEVGEDVACKLGWPPHNKGGDAIVTPRDNVVGRGVVYQLVCLC